MKSNYGLMLVQRGNVWIEYSCTGEIFKLTASQAEERSRNYFKLVNDSFINLEEIFYVRKNIFGQCQVVFKNGETLAISLQDFNSLVQQNVVQLKEPKYKNNNNDNDMTF